jgi:hypothetical protein
VGTCPQIDQVGWVSPFACKAILRQWVAGCAKLFPKWLVGTRLDHRTNRIDKLPHAAQRIHQVILPSDNILLGDSVQTVQVGITAAAQNLRQVVVMVQILGKSNCH